MTEKAPKAEKLNLYQKLAKIREAVEILQKNKKGYGYTYVDEALILANITGGMKKHGISLLPGIVGGTSVVEPYHYTKTKANKKKDGEIEIYEEHVNEIIVRADMCWTWVNNESPEERITVPWFLVGSQADASQAFGSGLTYSSRYFLLKYFNVSTSDDDPDNWRSRQREAEEREDTLIAERIVEQIHSFVQTWIEQSPNDRKKITEIVKKYARENGKPSANYYTIKAPATATELLDALKKEHTTKEDK